MEEITTCCEKKKKKKRKHPANTSSDKDREAKLKKDKYASVCNRRTVVSLGLVWGKTRSACPPLLRLLENYHPHTVSRIHEANRKIIKMAHAQIGSLGSSVNADSGMMMNSRLLHWHLLRSFCFPTGHKSHNCPKSAETFMKFYMEVFPILFLIYNRQKNSHLSWNFG